MIAELCTYLLKMYIRSFGLMSSSILAVIPCGVDVTTQGILKFAEAADPSGARTMVVLTKADLASEKATKSVVIELLLGKRNPLNLGYYAVQNRKADDETSTASERLALEKELFACPPWSAVADRCGVPALQARLRELLMYISKREFPHVKTEIETHLRQCRLELEAMGPSRSNQSSQRLHLSRIASKFQSITLCAVNGHYTADPIFTSAPALKLATRIIELNEALANIVWKNGHVWDFGEHRDEDEQHQFVERLDGSDVDFGQLEYPELVDMIGLDKYEHPEKPGGPIKDRVEEIFKSNRGPEVGTV